MAEISFDCDVMQGYNFSPDVQTHMGHLLSMQITEDDKNALQVDTKVEEPLKNEMVDVAGVISSIYWGGLKTDPIQITCQVSTQNKNIVQTLVHSTLKNTNVEFQFVIYEYDPQAKVYFECFHSGGEDLKGLVEKLSGDLILTIDPEQSTEVMSPQNFTFTISIMPDDEAEMAVQYAISEDKKWAKPWGIMISR